METWSQAQAANPMFGSPCFRPELIHTIGLFNPHVYVGVLEHDTGTAFFAFRRNWNRSIARPVPICDYQAIVSQPDAAIDLRGALRCCGLDAWYFQHLVAPPGILRQAEPCRPGASLQASLASGYDAYLADVKAAGRSLRHIQSQARFLERDLGPLRFTAQSSDTALLSLILKRKAQRYHGGEPPLPWILPALEAIRSRNHPLFGGVLATLHAGDHLVAAHFGMRSGRRLHFWFPMFDPQFSKYSPGKLLVHFLIRNLGEIDCDLLDFGPGDEDYKSYFSNRSLAIASGCYARRSLSVAIDRASRVVRAQARERLGYLRPLAQFLRRQTRSRAWRVAASQEEPL